MRYTLSAHIRAIVGFLAIVFVGVSYRHAEVVSWLEHHTIADGLLVLVGSGFHFFNVYFGRRATWATGS